MSLTTTTHFHRYSHQGSNILERSPLGTISGYYRRYYLQLGFNITPKTAIINLLQQVKASGYTYCFLFLSFLSKHASFVPIGRIDLIIG